MSLGKLQLEAYTKMNRLNIGISQRLQEHLVATMISQCCIE